VWKAVGGQKEEEKAIYKAVRKAVRRELVRSESGKINIYRGQIKQVEWLGEMLLYTVYYNGVDSIQGKARRLYKWMDSGRVIITTNTLGIGVDIPDIRLIVHTRAL